MLFGFGSWLRNQRAGCFLACEQELTTPTRSKGALTCKPVFQGATDPLPGLTVPTWMSRQDSHKKAWLSHKPQHATSTAVHGAGRLLQGPPGSRQQGHSMSNACLQEVASESSPTCTFQLSFRMAGKRARCFARALPRPCRCFALGGTFLWALPRPSICKRTLENSFVCVMPEPQPQTQNSCCLKDTWVLPKIDRFKTPNRIEAP